MSLDRIVEEIIQDAMGRGEFDNLPGRGKPLDLDACFALPEDERLAYTVLKNAGYVPEEVSLLKEIRTLKENLVGASATAERQRLNRELNARALEFDLLQEQKQRARRKARKSR